MKCENCNKEHCGSYGSGRFCSSRCARGFSTKQKREEINIAVSKKMQGRKTNSYFFTDEDREKAKKAIKIHGSYKKFSKDEFISYVLCENGSRWNGNKIKESMFEFGMKEEICEECGQEPSWNGKTLSLQLHHIDGNRYNNNIENIKIICPNCHTQTETFAKKNVGRYT